MVFIPGRTGVLHAHGNHGERFDGRAVGISRAVAGRRKSGITTRVRGCGTLQRSDPHGGIKLRQAIEGLVGKTIGGPVLTHGPQVMVETTVFLGQEDDVVDALQALGIARHQTSTSAQAH